MRILYVIDSLCGRGAEKLVADITTILSKNHYCEVLVLRKRNDVYSEELKLKGIKVNVIPYKKHISRIAYIKKYIRANNFDIVHANLFPVTYYCAIARGLIKKDKTYSLVMTEHNTDNRRRHIALLRPLEKYIYGKYDHIISISNQTQEALINWIRPQGRKKLSVVYNGIPLNTFFDATPYERTYISPALAKDDILICMVGSFAPAKNHIFMMEVMSELPERYKLICVGDGPLKEKVEQKIEQLNINNRVIMLGFRKDVARIIKTMDVMVIPSVWEGFGLVAAEGMACGIPIICSDVPGLSDIVGNVGIICRSNNKDDFQNAILNYMDRASPEALMQQAQKYNIEIMSEKYLEIYKEYTGCRK